MKLDLLNRIKHLFTKKLLVVIFGMLFILVLFLAIYLESFIKSSLFFDSKKQSLAYSLRADNSIFGSMYKLPSNNSWLYFGSGDQFNDAVDFFVPESATLSFLDGRSILIENNAYLSFYRDKSNLVMLTLKKGDLKVRPWANTYERLIIRAKNEIFDINNSTDFVEISYQNDELVVENYKRSGVVIKTEFVHDDTDSDQDN